MNESPKDNLAIRFRKLCRLIEQVNAQTKATLSSSPDGVELCRLLRTIMSDLVKRSNSPLSATLHPQYSRGKGSMPRVLWISFTNASNPFSGLSVSVCFDVDGKGAVCGLMDAVGVPTNKFIPAIRKTESKTPVINIDGPRPSAFYNNKYYNPVEFFKDAFDSETFVAHFDESLELLSSFN